MDIDLDIASQIPLSTVDRVVFYKRDEITTDLICCDVLASGQFWTFHEEAACWSDLIEHLSRLPGFRSDWYEAVVHPPFSASETVAYERR
ncbi:MAG: hypothetical protein ACTHOJ_00410 [Sphingomonas oligoaromativorans]